MLTNDAESVLDTRMVHLQMAVGDDESGEWVIWCNDDGMTGVRWELGVLQPPIYFQEAVFLVQIRSHFLQHRVPWRWLPV